MTEAAGTSIGAHATSAKSEVLIWFDFKWVNTPETERAALLVPVEVDGAQTFFQLDTGADGSVLYGGKARTKLDAKGYTKSGWQMANAAMLFAGTFIEDAPLVLMPDLADDDGISGSIGMNWLLGKVLTLDYARQRFCLSSDDQWIAAQLSPIQWLGAELHYGRLCVPVTLPHVGALHLMFDTGAGSAPLSIRSREHWLRLTGLSDIKQAPSHLSGGAWGQPIDIFAAPTDGAVQVAAISFDRATAWYVPQVDHLGGARWIYRECSFLEWDGYPRSPGSTALRNRELDVVSDRVEHSYSVAAQGRRQPLAPRTTIDTTTAALSGRTSSAADRRRLILLPLKGESSWKPMSAARGAFLGTTES